MSTRGDTYEDETPPDLTKVQTYILAQSNDEWFVAAFLNTKLNQVYEANPASLDARDYC